MERLIITIILTLWFFFGAEIGYTNNSEWHTHILYMLAHANIFHLLGNLLCLWMIRGGLNLFSSVFIAFACSFLPAFTLEPTMGFSGVIFAIVGSKWGAYGQLWNMCKKVLPFVLLTALIPNVNAAIHIYCLFGGYFIQYIIKQLRQ